MIWNMRNLLILVAVAIVAGIGISCSHKTTNNLIAENGVEKDTLWYIDSIYMHRMGESYQEGDSTFDRILVFKKDAIGDIVQYDELTDSVIFHFVYDYSFSPDSIIKHIYIDGIEKEMYYSVYELNDRGNIVKLSQRFGTYSSEIEYQYDMEDHLSLIYFNEYDNQCRWLWRDGNLERIVWGAGEHITEFLYDKERDIPFESVYTELPKLDILLSRHGYFGKQPKNAIFVTGEIENDQIVYTEAMFYHKGFPGVAVNQMCYQGLDIDSVEYSIHWDYIIE